MPRKRKSRTSKETMASTLLISEDSRFRRDFQCLHVVGDCAGKKGGKEKSFVLYKMPADKVLI